MGNQLLRNPDFEDSPTYIDPWTSTGTFGGSYGINSVAKNDTPAHGNCYAYVFGGPFEIGQQALGTKAGESYEATYYAYCWYYAPADPNATCSWTVGFGGETTTVSLNTIYNSTNVPAADWPSFAQQFQASADNVALSFTIPNNSVFYLDHTSLVCTSCPSKDHTPAIVGGVIGGLAGVSLLVLAIVYLLLRRKRRAPSQDHASSAPDARFMSPDATTAWSGSQSAKGGTTSYDGHTSGTWAPSSSGHPIGYPTPPPSTSGYHSNHPSSFGGFPEMMSSTPAPGAFSGSGHHADPDEVLVVQPGQGRTDYQTYQ